MAPVPRSPANSHSHSRRLRAGRELLRSRPRARRAAVSVAAAAGLLASAAAVPGAQAAASQARHVRVRHSPIIINLPKPVSLAKCQARYGVRCYTPAQLQAAYDLGPLYSRGITGRGRTIVIATPFGSPTIRNDIKVFDAQWGLPSLDLKIIQFGRIPPYDPNDGTRIEWAAGTTLQVEYAHAIAPGARIVIAETGISETAGAHGFPELMQAQQSLINAGVGDVITQITDAAENTFPGAAHGNYGSLLSLRQAFKDALAHQVTEVAAAGDSGAAVFDRSGHLFPSPGVYWPASDPLVTAVGGTQLTLDNRGRRLQPDVAWNDGSNGAGSGGLSAVFGRPLYQRGVSSVVGGHRGIPDIAMSAAVSGSAWAYLSFGGVGGPGWSLFNGTTQAAPMFAGIVALADQLAGHRLGLINPSLYLMGGFSHGSTGLVDVTQGNNSFGGVTGFDAGPGYDLATGWGTIDAARFVPALARLG